MTKRSCWVCRQRKDPNPLVCLYYNIYIFIVLFRYPSWILYCRRWEICFKMHPALMFTWFVCSITMVMLSSRIRLWVSDAGRTIPDRRVEWKKDSPQGVLYRWRARGEMIYLVTGMTMGIYHCAFFNWTPSTGLCFELPVRIFRFPHIKQQLRKDGSLFLI